VAAAGPDGQTLLETTPAFRDALEVNDSAVKILGDDILKAITRDLVETVKRILRQHGYPPDEQEKATQTVLEQAETRCEHWAGSWHRARLCLHQQHSRDDRG
jgi:type I restriction enzyme R subunit